MRFILTLLLSLVVIAPVSAQNPGAGNCIGFNGTSQYISVPHSATLNNATALTLEAWILPNGFGTNSYSNVIIGKDGWANGPEGYTLRCGGNGALSFNFGNGSGWVETTTANVLQTQSWQHVAATFDGTILRLYVNGVQVSSTNYTGSIAQGTYDLNFGRIPYTVGGTRHFQGELDEIRIWRSALSQSTLRDWMCKKVTASHPDYSQLGGYYRFDNGTGTVLTDMSPNSNNGLLMAGPIWGPSGASIGDTSVQAYSGTISLSIPGINGGNFTLDNVAGTPDGVHLYRVDEAPDLVNLPAGFESFDTSHYYGVYVVGGTSANFDVTLSYAGNSYIGPNDGCIAAIAGRAGNNFAVWYGITAAHLLAQNELYRATIGQQQFILARQPQPYQMSALGHVNFCPGDTAELATTSSANLTYAWYQNGTVIPSATASNYYATQGGAYYATVSDGTCSYPTDTVQLTVYTTPALSQTALGSICTNDGPQTLSATPPGGTFSGSGVNGNIFDPSFSGVGPKLVVYTYTDSNMCVTADTQLVTVHQSPQVSLAMPADLCSNADPINLSGGNPGGGVYSGAGVNSNVLDPSGLTAGNYPLSYTYTDPNGCSGSDTSSINILTGPSTPTVSVGGNTLYSSATSGNQWLLNGVPIPGATSNTYVPTTTGSYSVIVTLPNGCSSDTAAGLTYVGIESATALQWEAWPNPASDFLRVKWSAAAGTDYELTLIDLQGRILVEETGSTDRGGSQSQTLDLAELASGVYLLRLRTEEGQGLQKILRK